MLTSRRMLSLLLAAAAVIAILSGCYAAPVNEATEQGGETSGAIVTDSKIPVTTYPVPEENIRTFGNMAASASTGGFWQWDTFFRPYIQAYDPVTRTTYVPCYQSGCRHNDPTCNACFGDLQSLVEYRENYYAMVLYGTTRQPRLSSRVRCPAARFKFSPVGNRKTRMRHAGVCCDMFPLGRHMLPRTERPMH